MFVLHVGAKMNQTKAYSCGVTDSVRHKHLDDEQIVERVGEENVKWYKLGRRCWEIDKRLFKFEDLTGLAHVHFQNSQKDD